MGLENELGCLGHFGFGTGYGTVKGYAGYCNSCPRATVCWEEHKKICKQLFPALVEVFEEMAEKIQGPELVKRFQQLYDAVDPYTTRMVGNVEDGMLVASTGKPKYRDQATLPWPFKKEGEA
jgi:hypothetical protein